MCVYAQAVTLILMFISLVSASCYLGSCLYPIGNVVTVYDVCCVWESLCKSFLYAFIDHSFPVVLYNSNVHVIMLIVFIYFIRF